MMGFIYKSAVLVCGIAIGSVTSYLAAKLVRPNSAVVGVEQTASNADDKNYRLFARNHTPSAIDSEILLDSIITIVQNYYVDEERTNNNLELLKGALGELVENKFLSVKTVGDNKVYVRNQKQVVSIAESGSISFDDLISVSSIISEAIENTSLNEKNLDKESGTYIFLNAMFQSLDPHSSMLSGEEYRELRQGTEGSFGGLGVVVGIQDDLLTVIKPIPKSPAARAGIHVNDRITLINDQSTFGTSLQQLVHHMRGDPGTEVDISLLRQGYEAPLKMKLKREIIQVDSLESELIQSSNANFLLMRIESFSSRTSDEIRTAYSAHSSKRKIDGIILDLRDNPGGLLDQAVKSADIFLKSGDIVSTSGRRPEVEVAYDDGDEIEIPTVVLVNNNTASASEILTAALQDNNKAIVIGQPTFGKGSVQTVFELPGDQALKLTISRYYSPMGRVIQNRGVTPDIWVQPIKKKKENVNLQHDNPYGGEASLKNSLIDKKNGQDKNYRHKFFYLKDHERDFEQNFAINLLRNLTNRDSQNMTFDQKRASYWLASTSPLVRKIGEQEFQKVDSYLSEEFSVKWLPQDRKVNDNNLALNIGLEGGMQVMEGETIQIPWSLDNKGESSVEQVSLYIRTHSSSVLTREILLGHVPAGQKLSGSIPYRILVPADDYTLEVGYALGGQVASKVQKIKLRVSESRKPNMSYEVKVQEGAESKFNGVLEPGEKAIILVTVKNNSDVSAHKVFTKLSNLSGNQIKVLHSGELGQDYIGNGAQAEFSFPILVSKKLKSKDIHFGVTIDSREYLSPLKDSHVIRAKPIR